MERIAKFLSKAGVASRRQAEQMIAKGLVAINGAILQNPVAFVDEDDVVTVNGRAISVTAVYQQETVVFALYKPLLVLTTRSDPNGRTTVFDILPEHLRHLIAVGRLDYNSEGLLLLTNNGALARHLELPNNSYKRAYKVRFFGKITSDKIKALASGISIDGMQYQPIAVKLIKDRNCSKNQWCIVSLHEGKNREIRKTFKALDLQVNRLIRIQYDAVVLEQMQPGDIKKIDSDIVKDWIKAIDAKR